MRIETLLGSSWVLLVLATAVHAASPDDPGSPAPPMRYQPVTSGTKSYRPVEPLPWGDVNRRVMPKDAQPSDHRAPRVPRDGEGEAGPPPNKP
jgi:hypothetical protein